MAVDRRLIPLDTLSPSAGNEIAKIGRAEVRKSGQEKNFSTPIFRSS
jgi:hypothetical protein